MVVQLLNAIIGNEIVISKAIKWINKKIGDIETNVIASFHPAFLMRQPDQKKYAWEDLKMIRKKISEFKIKFKCQIRYLQVVDEVGRVV